MQEIVYAVDGNPRLYDHRDHPKDCVKLVAEKIEHWKRLVSSTLFVKVLTDQPWTKTRLTL